MLGLLSQSYITASHGVSLSNMAPPAIAYRSTASFSLLGISVSQMTNRRSTIWVDIESRIR